MKRTKPRRPSRSSTADPAVEPGRHDPEGDAEAGRDDGIEREAVCASQQRVAHGDLPLAARWYLKIDAPPRAWIKWKDGDVRKVWARLSTEPGGNRPKRRAKRSWLEVRIRKTWRAPHRRMLRSIRRKSPAAGRR